MRRFEFTSWRSTRSRVFSVAAGALVAVASLVGSSHAGIVYNAGSEFNGQQGGSTGVWNYGRVDLNGANYTQANTYIGSQFQFSDYGTSGSANEGLLISATLMHPGGYNDGGRANLRFTAPSAGTYLATFIAKLADTGNNPFTNNNDFRRDGVRMWVDGTNFYDLQTWNEPTIANSFQYQTVTKTVTMTAGQTLDFSIDPNGAYAFEYGRRDPPPPGNLPPYLGYNLFDSVEYTATMEKLSSEVVPEPGMFVIAAFNVAGMIVARRRKTRHA